MIIQSNRLSVVVATPGEGWADTNRFDHTGVVTSVVLDGRHRFCTPEQIVAGRATTGGIGLVAEFQGKEMIEAAETGGRYHKIGAGILVNDGRPITPYSTVGMEIEGYEWTVERNNTSITFEQTGRDVNGWAFSLSRNVSVSGNELVIEAMLKNNGTRHMDLEEYNHNFLNINDMPIGPDYALSLSYKIKPDEPVRGVLCGDGKEFWFEERPKTPFYLSSTSVGDAPYYGWTLSAGGIAVSEKVSERPCRTAIWGVEHVVSTEVFVSIRLMPGEKKTWRRVWTFSA